MPTDHLGWLTCGFGVLVVAYFILSFQLYINRKETKELRDRYDGAWSQIKYMIENEVISVEIRLVGLVKGTNRQKLTDYLEHLRKRLFREPFR